MSTRYVWNKYNKTTSVTYDSSSGEFEVTVNTSSNTIDVATGFTVQDGIFVLTGSKATVRAFIDGSGGTTQNANRYRYALSPIGNQLWDAGEGQPTNAVWRFEKIEGYDDYLYIQDGAQFETLYNPRATDAQGSYIDKVSSSSSDYYPSNGSAGNYWYIYQGSDNIDPYSVTYSTTSPTAGNLITIIANTRVPTYGGTLYYQFLYSTDGGNVWYGFQNKSTTPSATLTVPNGATQFRGKVITSDDWGFTSPNQLAGANLTVQSTKAYVGVNNTARSISKMYIGVNGKAREVIAGYIGVNGKARKFM